MAIFFAAIKTQEVDGVWDFDRGATLASGRAFQPANLRQTGPLEMPGPSRADMTPKKPPC
jgi:hypothetical protein